MYNMLYIFYIFVIFLTTYALPIDCQGDSTHTGTLHVKVGVRLVQLIRTIEDKQIVVQCRKFELR